MNYITEPLSNEHRKQEFRCGKPLLDNYLHIQAKQDVKRKLAACFILPDTDRRVKGYYTLSSSSVDRSLVPQAITVRLPPSYKNLPATLMGRLAVSSEYQAQGIGGLLLVDALRRTYDSLSSIATMAIIVDPIDSSATSFYLKFGFIELPDSGKMFLPMDTAKQLF